MVKGTWIDPSAGWLYGFPKIMPDYVTNVKQWLLDNGYPQSEIDNGGMRYRTWVDGWTDMKPELSDEIKRLKKKNMKLQKKLKVAQDRIAYLVQINKGI